MEGANEKTIWTVKKFMDSKPSTTYIPTLNTDAASNTEKAAAFRASFFPLPPPADLTDLHNETEYPEAVPINKDITMEQLHRAVNKLSPNKAPGPDEISNRVLKKTISATQHHLLTLIQTSFTIGHFPTPFKTTTTVVLRKPGKPDYTTPKAYRPIALENTLGKVMESVIAELLSYISEDHQLLPPQHFGGRPGRTTEDAMMILSERIHAAWKKREIFSVVFMDVAGAFNNVHHERLIHNMRKRKVPQQITNWIHSFLQDRTTRLRFNGTLSDVSIPTPAGTPQGSPLSPTLYMYYNGDLLDIPSERELSLGFIDDIAYGVEGHSDWANAERLRVMLEEAEEWRRMHGAQFERSKYMLVHFNRNSRRQLTSPIGLAGVDIHPTNEARYLGVIFDSQLRFRSHLNYITKKGTKFALAMASIARATWGAHYKHIRQLFNAVVAPRTDYAASIWHRPGDKRGPRTAQVGKLTSVQRLAMRAITGCYKTTPTSALEVETGLPPAELRLRGKVLRTLTRMQTRPPQHPLKSWINNAIHNCERPATFTSNLQSLIKHFPEYRRSMEVIRPYIRPPWWRPPMTLRIDPTKEDAKKYHEFTIREHEASLDTLCIYTDGSGINGYVGAAATCPKIRETKHYHLGSDKEHDVFAAELKAMCLALQILNLGSQSAITQCIIYSDSQAALQATMKPAQQSGQETIKEFLDNADQLQTQRRISILLIWIPGHMDIIGNEMADEAAKHAANLNHVQPSFSSPVMKAAQNAVVLQKINQEWTRLWQTEQKTAKELRRICKKPTAESEPKLYQSLEIRRDIADLIRLRTEHCGLNNYLHKIGREESPLCSCGNNAKETVKHLLLKCEIYEKQREKLRRELGTGTMRLEILLGNSKAIKQTLELVKNTGRLETNWRH